MVLSIGVLLRLCAIVTLSYWVREYRNPISAARSDGVLPVPRGPRSWRLGSKPFHNHEMATHVEGERTEQTSTTRGRRARSPHRGGRGFPTTSLRNAF